MRYLGDIMKTLASVLKTLAATLTVASGVVIAAPVAPSPTPAIDFSSSACADYGDFQFCSAQFLNYLATGSPDGTQSTQYIVQSSQGLLQSAVVVLTNGQAAVSNADIGTNIDNAYEILATPGQDSVYGTSILAGQNAQQAGIIDPDTVVIGETANAQPVSNQTAWDIGLSALITALTFDGARHDMLIFFDNNQEGSTQPQNILVSGLVCVRDAAGVLDDICYELVDPNGTLDPNPNIAPGAFNTALDYGDQLGGDQQNPFGGTNVLANGTLCVDDNPASPTYQRGIAFNVDNANSCPIIRDDGTITLDPQEGVQSVFINNNLGSNVVEFIGGIPELNARLEELLGLGYDVVSVQLLFQNQNDGFEDVFILAGPAITQVPLPGTLLLLGLGLGALAVVARRRRKF